MFFLCNFKQITKFTDYFLTGAQFTLLPIPQDYFGQVIIPPNQDPTVGYIGQLPTNASNIQMDASGEILFFIVNDFVYDKNGYFIDQLQVNVNGQYAKGASEICIVPNAFHCGRYYIITTHIEGNKKTPVIFEIDMTVPNIHDLNRYSTGICGKFCNNAQ